MSFWTRVSLGWSWLPFTSLLNLVSPTSRDKVVDYLSHPDPVARETALRTLTVLLPPKIFAERCEEMTDDDDEHVSRYAESLLTQVGGILEVADLAPPTEVATV